MKTKAEIIRETAEFYGENPTERRALEISDERYDRKPACRYLTDDGKMCAVGRCLTPEALAWAKDHYGSVYNLVFNWRRNYADPDEMFRPEYRGHLNPESKTPELFWRRLQKLHDNRANWDDDGLTPEGETYLKFLLEKYGSVQGEVSRRRKLT